MGFCPSKFHHLPFSASAHSNLYRFYVALAERLGLPLWTADRSLYRQARKAGAGFVRCFPDDWKQAP